MSACLPVIYGVLIFAACFLILRYIKGIFTAIWLYMPAFTIVCALYTAMMAVGLGSDIVVQSGEHLYPALVSIFAIFFWSFIVWYSTRMVMYVRYPGEAVPPTLVFQFPRFLGYHCFVAIQAAILALRSITDLSSWGIVGFVAAQSLYFILLTRAFDPTYKASSRNVFFYISLVIGITYIAFFIWLAVSHAQYRAFDSPLRHTFWLPMEAIVVFIMQVSILWGYINRKEITYLGGPQTRLFQTYRAFFTGAAKWLGMDEPTAQAEWFYFLAFNVIGGIGFALYVLVILYLSWAVTVGALAFALIAFSILIGFFCAISCLSIRFRFNINIVIIIVAVIMSHFGVNPHQVRVRPLPFSNTHPITTDSFFDKWLSQKGRLDSIHRGPYTAYIILSDGGGSRAGTWVGKVMSHIQDRTCSRFGDHILVMAGASGGTIGNTSFYTLLRGQMEGRFHDGFRGHIDTFYTADFLTYTAGRFLGPDFFRYLIPLPMGDRAAALEVAMESSGRDAVIDSYLRQSVDSVFDYTGSLPAFFINSTEINGMPGYVSQVNLKDERINIKLLMDDSTTMNMSTAAVLSSRFPYISPAGDIGTLDFVDGGYFDNSGAGTAKSFMGGVYEALAARNDTLLNKNLKFQLVEIRNSTVVQPESKAINPLVNDLLTPVVTLVGMQNASTKMGTDALTRYMCIMDHDLVPLTINLYDPNYKAINERINKKDTIEEDYPMSWVNSIYQLHRMDRRLDALEADTSSEINKIERNLCLRK